MANDNLTPSERSELVKLGRLHAQAKLEQCKCYAHVGTFSKDANELAVSAINDSTAARYIMAGIMDVVNQAKQRKSA